MKKLLLGAASAVALLAAGSAFAAGNASTIDQIGYAENASVDQSGSPSDAVAQITQGVTAADEYNSANVTQGGGAGNQASITQNQVGYAAVSDPSNVSNSDQQGTDGTITVVQEGNNSSSISQLQFSSYEHALVGQSDNYNSAGIQQGGTQELAVVNQEEGTGNSASIVQSGTGDNVYAPSLLTATPPPPGPNNLQWYENVPTDSVLPGTPAGDTVYGPVGAVVDQNGSNNIGNINQAGFQNFADVAQGGQDGSANNVGSISQGASLYQSDGVMYQDGHNNIAAINQSGAGTTYSTVWQNGNSNQAYSTQVGSEHSVIGQGVTGDDGAYPNTVTSDFASVDQTSGGDNSLVTQLGDNDAAYVAQTSTANATSTILQNGNYDVASVHQ
ncbi:MAG TPA: hypothetical protein VN814_14600 [Caulobacteraceae bacterium]|nr:hypothetical protein [Caulobacteraceae bacterium]